jgi:NADPH2:quinone reductase
LEVSGEIIKLGLGDNHRYKVGDKVCALVAGGGYSQLCIAPLTNVLPVPKNVTLQEAAGIPETFFTVWSNFLRVNFNSNSPERILVHGGTSGIGVTAIQIAKSFGAQVIVTCGTDKKIESCLKIGADAGVNYHTDWAEQVLKLTDGKGVTVVLDMVGGDYIQKDITSCSEEGRIVIIAVQGGLTGTVNWFDVMRKRIVITGSTLRARESAYKGEIADSLLKNIWPMLESGRINVHVSKVFPLSEAQQAHEYLESGVSVGKVILNCSD